MRQELELYLAGKKVEFNQPPAIMYNYTETDVTNPTAIKNGFSNTITIEGTPENNDIFGHLWDLERLQNYGVGNYAGSTFNPIQRADFTLYLNGEMYESGYFKLDEVRKTGKLIEYDITLYGGLGDFFYALTYTHNSEGEVEGPDKLELADLEYEAGDLDFTISKETVKEAWDSINNYTYDGKWSTINFLPAYNGVPDKDFSADKVIIDRQNIVIDGHIGGTGYAVGTLPKGMTEWETFDLRSYFQKPVLRVKEVIKACCNPANNGGYEVYLDNHFFNEGNPYYSDNWVTLPSITSLELDKVDNTSTSGSLSNRTTNFYKLNIENPGLTYDFLNLGVKVTFNPSTSYTGALFTTHTYRANGGVTLQKFIKKYEYASAIDMQLVAVKNGQVVAYSNVQHLVTPIATIDASFEKLGKEFKKKGDLYDVPIPGVDNRYGTFGVHNGQIVWCNQNGVEEPIQFKLNSGIEFDEVFLKVKNRYNEYANYTWGSSDSESASKFPSMKLYSEYTTIDNSWRNNADDYKAVDGTLSFGVQTVSIGHATERPGKSGVVISKKNLLSLGVTPCDFLISYAKMFGLYFYKEVEGKVIHIMDRNSFYKHEDIVDLEKLIDRSKAMKITPQIASTKYYDFNIEQVESEYNNDWKEVNGSDYGLHRLNTSYNFNAESTDVFEDNIFRGGAMTLEINPLYQRPQDGTNLPMYLTNGGVVTVDDNEISLNEKWSSSINSGGRNNHDFLPKVQFHTADNKPVSDTNMVMMLYRYPVNTTVPYWLTDDMDEMYSLNDGMPCWLLTHGESNAIRLDVLPYFSRFITYGGELEGNITHTLDMGKPQAGTASSVPGCFNTDGSSIYERCWKGYVNDMYDVNNRKLSCSCLLRNRPNPDWLRRFYWFDNSIWRLNKITDWNVSSYETTAMEFLKVQDIDNYKVEEITVMGGISIILDQNTIGAEGGTITGWVRVQDGGPWYTDMLNITPDHGTGDTRITVTIPANTGEEREIRVIVTTGDVFANAYITQAGTAPTPSFDVVPDNIQIDWYTQSAIHYDTLFNRIDVTSQNNWTAQYTEIN